MTIDKNNPPPAPGEPGAPSPAEWLEQADKPAPEGVRSINQSPLFDPSIDDDDEIEDGEQS